MTTKKRLALASACTAVGIALGVGLPMAQATEGGGSCNNYGDGAVVVAPFCGAQFGGNSLPTPTATPTSPPIPSEPSTPSATPPTTIDRGPFVPVPTSTGQQRPEMDTAPTTPTTSREPLLTSVLLPVPLL